MEWIILLLLVVIASVFIKAPAGKGYSYRQLNPLFSAAERSFLGVLDKAVSDKNRVFGKVRVADILAPTKGMNRKNWQIAFNKISAKHFDYVLCSKDKLNVVAVIELDDKSHNTKKSKISRLNTRECLQKRRAKTYTLSRKIVQSDSSCSRKN